MSPNNQIFRDCAFITLLLCLLFFFLLGTRPLWVPDEGRYAEIAREMALSNDFITPYLNGVIYFEKPILFYWLGALAIKIGGLNLWSLRSINALLAIIGCLATYYTGSKLYGRMVGLLACFILATSGLYFVMAHVINLDLTVSVFLALCLYSFIISTRETNELKRRNFLYAMYVFAALATLTKGLIGIVFPMLIIGSYLLFFEHFWTSLKRLYILPGLLLFLTISVPWHVLVSLKHPDFPYFYFIEQHFLRYTVKGVGHYQPVWFFIPSFILGFFPWIIFLPQALVSAFKSLQLRSVSYQQTIFFALWGAIIFIFFSLSSSKLIPYILPIFPPISILVGIYLAYAIKQQTFLKPAFLLLIVASFVFFIFSFFIAHYIDLDVPKQETLLYFVIPPLVLTLGLSLSYLFLKKNYQITFIAIFFTLFLFYLSFMPTLPYFDLKTIKPLACILNKRLKQGDEVITLNRYFQDLPFYIRKRITIVNWHNELKHGMRFQNTKEWLIGDDDFWERWHSNRRMYALMSNKDFNRYKSSFPYETFYLIGKTELTTLATNHLP